MHIFNKGHKIGCTFLDTNYYRVFKELLLIFIDSLQIFASYTHIPNLALTKLPYNISSKKRFYQTLE